MVEPLQSNLSLANGSHSVQDHGPTFASSPIRHGPIISSSRPPSTAAITSNKKLPQLPPRTTTSPYRAGMNSTHVMSESEHAKPRKKTFFGMITIPGSRRSSISKSRPTTPHSSTPDNSLSSRQQRKPDLATPSPPPQYHDFASIPLNDRTNYRWNGDVSGQQSQPSCGVSVPDSGLGIETVVTKTKLVAIVASQPRQHLLSAPDVPTLRASPAAPRIGNGPSKPRRVDVDETDRLRLQDPSPSGRVSPLMVLANSKVFGGRKGKEREGSVDRTKDARKPTPAPAPENERGRQSQNSKNTTNISGPMTLNVTRGRIKHGSFDFERPLSTSVGYPVRNARWSASGSYRTSSETDRTVTPNGNGQPWNGPSSSTYPIQEERPSLGRSQSVRESDRERGQPKIRFADETKGTQSRGRNPYDTRSRPQPQPQHAPPPTKSTGRGVGPTRNASTHTNLPYRPEGGSWGRNTPKRVGLGGAGHIPGLPSFGMSATSLQLDEDANGPPSRSNSPQVVTIPMDRSGMRRHMGKGRSLDLGLELNWAPTRVRREAVMDFSEMGVRSKWREEAEMKEFSRMKVLESFEQVLGENGYAKFRECAFPS